LRPGRLSPLRRHQLRRSAPWTSAMSPSRRSLRSLLRMRNRCSWQEQKVLILRSHAERGVSKDARRFSRTFLAIAAVIALTPTAIRAEPRDDFIAGKSRDCPCCDLTGFMGKRGDFSGANFAGANLTRVNFHDAKLVGANLAGANLSEANLNKADLSRANLNGANLQSSMLYAARLDLANLSSADLTGVYMGTARLTR